MRNRRGGDGPIWKRLVNEQTGKIAEIRLSKFGTFSCVIGDDRKTSQTASDVETWANEIIAIIDSPIEWIPVIDVKATADRYRYGRGSEDLRANVDVGASRYWVARTHTGQWRIVEDWSKLDPKKPGRLDWQEALAASRPWNEANAIENPNDFDVRHRSAKPRPFRFPYQASEGRVVMKYDDALWRGVKKLVDEIDRALDTIRELLASEEGQDHLRAVAAGTAQFAIAAESESTRAEKRKRKS